MPDLMFDLLAGAGNVAMIAVAVGFWRVDRRLMLLEWKIARCVYGCGTK